VQLKKSGNNFMGLCPFHHEKSPSFSVSADKQLFYCFGCGKGGGAFQFLMDHDGYSFPEVVEYLAEKAGLSVPQSQAPDADEQARRKRALALLDRVTEAFAKTLVSEEGSAGRDYFHRRKLPDDLIRRYRLGFAPPGYGFLARSIGRDARVLAQLETVGLLFKGERGYADRFRGRVVFPIRDRRGQVVGFGGRILDQGEPKYLNSPETPYFHKSDLLYGFSEHRDEIRKRKLLLVVEGYMDVLALAAHDLPVGLAPLGTAIGERQVREILRLNDAPVFCFDGDRAGKQASWRALERMLPVLDAEHGPRFLYLPDGEDPDSLLQQEGAEAFVQRIENEAKPILKTWIDGLLDLAGRGPEGRARMAKKADAMLATMKDDYLRQAWRLEAENVTKLNLKDAAKPRRSTPRRNIGGVAPDAKLREDFVAALVQNPARVQALPAGAEQFFLDDDGLNELYTRVLHVSTDDKHPIQTLIHAFPEDERIPRWATQAETTDDEFCGLLLAIEQENIKRCLRQGDLSTEEITQLKRREIEINRQRRG